MQACNSMLEYFGKVGHSKHGAIKSHKRRRCLCLQIEHNLKAYQNQSCMRGVKKLEQFVMMLAQRSNLLTLLEKMISPFLNLKYEILNEIRCFIMLCHTHVVFKKAFKVQTKNQTKCYNCVPPQKNEPGEYVPHGRTTVFVPLYLFN